MSEDNNKQKIVVGIAGIAMGVYTLFAAFTPQQPPTTLQDYRGNEICTVHGHGLEGKNIRRIEIPEDALHRVDRTLEGRLRFTGSFKTETFDYGYGKITAIHEGQVTCYKEE